MVIGPSPIFSSYPADFAKFSETYKKYDFQDQIKSVAEE